MGLDGVLQFTREEVLAQVISLYAGAAAELRLDSSREVRVRAGARSDDETAAAWLGNGAPRRHPGLREPKRKVECRERARAFVAEHWREIEAIAKALLGLGQLDGTVADIILDLVNGKSTLKEALVYQVPGRFDLVGKSDESAQSPRLRR